MHKYYFFYFSIIILCQSSCHCQQKDDFFDSVIQKEVIANSFPKQDFISPLGIELHLAGSFAEIRGTHFHSGIDIRTNEKIGYNVYCPCAGYVSRIKIQSSGGGKNLYITHPNGYTSVYMHLDKYCGAIDSFVTAYQYKNQTYTFDYTFQKPEIFLSQGQIIALSGETGAAQGPHLHYELRKTNSQEPINPLFFGLEVLDTLPPIIKSLAISPLKDAFVDNGTQIKIINSSDSAFLLCDTIKALGKIYFSIQAYDPSCGSTAKNGVYSTMLFVDTTMIFKHCINQISFSDYGYVNACVDYPILKQKGKRMLCSRLWPNGKLPFNYYKNQGILDVKKDSSYTITWLLMDTKRNYTKHSFVIIGRQDSIVNQDSSLLIANNNNTKDLYYSKQNIFSLDKSSEFIFNKNTLYDNITIDYDISQNKYSNSYTIYKDIMPLKNDFTIKIKPYKIDPLLKDKYLLVRINKNGRKSSIGGKLINNQIVGTASSFGTFAVWVDNQPPKIRPLNFRNNKRIKRSAKTIKFTITDNLSGIRSYKGYLNDKWVLMQYDAKRNQLIYSIDENLNKGKNKFKLVVTDMKNNSCSNTYTIIR